MATPATPLSNQPGHPAAYPANSPPAALAPRPQHANVGQLQQFVPQTGGLRPQPRGGIGAIDSSSCSSISSSSSSDSSTSSSENERRRRHHQDAAACERYKRILVCDNNCLQFSNDVTTFHLHFERSLWQGEESANLLGSVSEQEALADRASGKLHSVIIKMFIWRRSTLKTIFALMIIPIIFELIDARNGLQDFFGPGNVPIETMTFAQYQSGRKGASFTDYSTYVIIGVKNSFMRQTIVFFIIASSATAFLSMSSLLCVWLATINWLALARSRSYVLAAWFLCTAAPFAASVCPAEFFINSREPARLVDIYKKELIDQLNLDERLEQVEKLCKELNSDEGIQKNLAQVESKANEVCSYIDHLPKGKIRYPASLFEWKELDFSPAHAACLKVRTKEVRKHVHQVLKAARRTCAVVKPFLKELQENRGNAPELVDYVTSRAVPVAQTLLSLSLSIAQFGMMLPTVASIPSGLLKGALRMKMLLPQSVLPGMLILLLPWLYAPLNWCLYSVPVQFFDSVFLLLGLLLLTVCPLGYFILGRLYGLGKPMTDSQVRAILAKINARLFWVTVAAVILMIVGIVNIGRSFFNSRGLSLTLSKKEQELDYASKLERDILGRVFNVTNLKSASNRVTMTIVRFILSFARSYYLSSAAGTDYMTSELIAFRCVERELKGALAANVLLTIATKIQSTRKTVMEYFKQFDKEEAGVLTHQDMDKAIEKLGGKALTKDDLKLVKDEVDRRNTGYVFIKDLVKAVKTAQREAGKHATGRDIQHELTLRIDQLLAMDLGQKVSKTSMIKSPKAQDMGTRESNQAAKQKKTKVGKGKASAKAKSNKK